MKKKLVGLIAFIIILMISGCSVSEEISKNTDDIHNEFLSNEDANNISKGRYIISSLPGNIDVSEDYNVYSLDNEFTEEMCINNSITMETVMNYLSISQNTTNIKMLIIPKGESFENPDFVIEIKIKSNKDYGVDNYREFDDNMFSEAAQALVSGFGCSDYSVEEDNNVKYVVFDPSNISNERRYATIIKGKMVYFIAKYKDNEISEKENSDLKKIALSLEY